MVDPIATARESRSCDQRHRGGMPRNRFICRSFSDRGMMKSGPRACSGLSSKDFLFCMIKKKKTRGYLVGYVFFGSASHDDEHNGRSEAHPTKPRPLPSSSGNCDSRQMMTSGFFTSHMLFLIGIDSRIVFDQGVVIWSDAVLMAFRRCQHGRLLGERTQPGVRGLS
jgi:hypothetical protein